MLERRVLSSNSMRKAKTAVTMKCIHCDYILIDLHRARVYIVQKEKKINKQTNQLQCNTFNFGVIPISKNSNR